MNLFCQCFCVFGQTEEEWHEAWQILTFDRTTDNIDKFISMVKWLARQLRFRDQSILIKLKQLFPEKADTWLVLHDLDDMCGYLKRLYSPYNLKQTETAQHTPTLGQPLVAQGVTPFLNAMTQDPYHVPIGQPEKNVHFDEESLLSQTLDHLNDTLTCMAMFDKSSNCRSRDHWNSQPPKPFKPYITWGRHQELRSHKHNRKANNQPHRPPHRDNTHGRSPSPGQDRNRSFSHPCGRSYDQSPTTKKPRSSSCPIDKEKDRCFCCQ